MGACGKSCRDLAKQQVMTQSITRIIVSTLCIVFICAAAEDYGLETHMSNENRGPEPKIPSLSETSGTEGASKKKPNPAFKKLASKIKAKYAHFVKKDVAIAKRAKRLAKFAWRRANKHDNAAVAARKKLEKQKKSMVDKRLFRKLERRVNKKIKKAEKAKKLAKFALRAANHHVKKAHHAIVRHKKFVAKYKKDMHPNHAHKHKKRKAKKAKKARRAVKRANKLAKKEGKKMKKVKNKY